MRDSGERFLREKITKIRVAVIGDIMLDRYVMGRVERISPEAPVPVNLIKSQREVLGGAANTAANLSSLGCHVFLAGLRGNDNDGKDLEKLFRESGIDQSGVLVSSDYRTTTKIRILGDRQQMMRLDYEEKRILQEEETERILSWLEALLENKLGSIVLSDYGKGMITYDLSQKVIKTAAAYGVPVLADPKGTDWSKYDGAYGVTPNMKELSDCLGKHVDNLDEKIEEAGEKIREKYHLENLFVTRSEKGLTCINCKGSIHRASMAQDVFDVSGAGDTVMAVLAAATAEKTDTETALELANTAAGIAVSKVGTYQIKREELLDAWCRFRYGRITYIPTTWEEAKRKVALWKNRGERIVFTNGCFDLLHRGHITYLEQAAALGDRLIVGLNSDKSVKRLKGECRPLNTESDRAFMLAALRMIDEVVIFDEDTPEKLISVLEPDVLVKGGDYKPEKVAGREYAGKVEIVSFVDGYSTTKMIEKIKEL